MVELASVEMCSGCAACFAVCSRDAIAMRPDDEGFLRPVVDAGKCVGCGACQRACPVLTRGEAREPLAIYAAFAKDEELRLRSSSGGVFSLLARQTIARGGIVYGAAIRESDLMVAHRSAENEEELAALRGSKYVQSDVGDCYRQAKGQLVAGRQVLFSGTPCQVAALRRVVGHEDINLICIEVICHAAPSPLAWQRYLAERKSKEGGRGSATECGIDPRRISFRRKNCGWKRFSLSLRFANDKEYLADLRTDPFLRGFLAELYNRPSCHHCAVRELRSGADLTVADYWNVHQTHPEMDDDKGTSLVLVNTEKGAKAFESVQDECLRVKSTYENAQRTNPAVVRSSPPNPRREKFFAGMSREAEFDELVIRLLKRPFYRRIGSYLKRLIRRFVA